MTVSAVSGMRERGRAGQQGSAPVPDHTAPAIVCCPAAAEAGVRWYRPGWTRTWAGGLRLLATTAQTGRHRRSVVHAEQHTATHTMAAFRLSRATGPTRSTFRQGSRCQQARRQHRDTADQLLRCGSRRGLLTHQRSGVPFRSTKGDGVGCTCAAHRRGVFRRRECRCRSCNRSPCAGIVLPAQRIGPRVDYSVVSQGVRP